MLVPSPLTSRRRPLGSMIAPETRSPWTRSSASGFEVGCLTHTPRGAAWLRDNTSQASGLAEPGTRPAPPLWTGVLQVTLDSRFREPANSYLHEAVIQSFHKDVLTVSCIFMFTVFKSPGAFTTQQSDWVYLGSGTNRMERVSDAMIFNLRGQLPCQVVAQPIPQVCTRDLRGLLHAHSWRLTGRRDT